MFSDGEERRQTWQGSGSAGSKEWQDAEEVPGQILQAINTSLTNRHKMADTPEKPQDSENGGNTVSVSVNNGIAEASNESSSKILADVQGGAALNVEPRNSFLHGAATKPSAIYGPASDLFVSRSNSSSSSSSSSSDDQGKISLSVNVIVKNDPGPQTINGNTEIADETPEGGAARETTLGANQEPTRKLKKKPKIPAKPAIKQESNDTRKEEETLEDVAQDRADEDAAEDATYYSEIPEGSKSTADYMDAYTDGNIYHEVIEKDILKPEDADPGSKTPGRESKLAALAVELEQARNNSTGTKRQAPAPPKVPDPPAEDPPSCAGRVSPTDSHQTFSTFRGEAFGFSSASSTTSTSSQDTEAGYASWNLHGDPEDPSPKHKSKSSFLLAQYSKCKMLATGIAEDSAKARKKFSIKKLLKIGKEPEPPMNADAASPKAWKYNEHFERPRAKLEIIHPMDLENKTVTVNPGFDTTAHTGSMTSFGANQDHASYRNSLSNSDYGSFYSDTLSPAQDMKSEVNYEYIQPRIPTRDDNEEMSSKAGTSSSNSPTPSRSSTASHSSTVTSGSSKQGASQRPPKPPPPPRAHSLLPSNKITQNVDGTFRFPNNGDTSSGDEVTIPLKKPQPPRRQCKSATIQSAYSNSDLRKSTSDLQNYNQRSDESLQDDVETSELERSFVKNVSTIQITHSNSQTSQNIEDMKAPVLNSPSSEGVYDNLVTETEPKIQASIIIQPGNSTQKEKMSKSMLTRNKQSPVTKSPPRPPPIYSKPQGGNFPKNLQPWKTLEDSYLALTSSNRELLIKLVNKASKRKKNFASKINKCQFQWSDFDIDATQTSSVFAFGEKIAYHATMPQYPEYLLTLVVSVQHPQSTETTEIKYPMFGKFVDCIPSYLLDSSEDSSELEAIPATVLILDRSVIATAESYAESLPNHLTEDHEKELAFIILQLIQSLKSLQVQGIEAIDCNFQNIILAKTHLDKYHSLIFLYDGCFEDNDFSEDACKVSLCQYALMLLFQILKLQTAEEDLARFSSKMSRKVFVMAFSLLSEEKAVSLSQTKILLECFLWGVTKVIESLQTLDDCDSVFQRWLDIERSVFIKSVASEDGYDLNVQNEYYSQFLIRTSARNIKEIASYL